MTTPELLKSEPVVPAEAGKSKNISSALASTLIISALGHSVGVAGLGSGMCSPTG